MGMVKTFCMCCNVRSGSLFCGIYTLLSSAIYTGMIMMRFIGSQIMQESQAHAVITYLTFVLYGLMAVFSIMLVIGVHMDRRNMIVPWIVQSVLCLLFGTATVCWLYVYSIKQDKDVHIWESIILTYHVFNVVITIYCMICVFSQFQELTLGRGTWRHHRPRRPRGPRQTLAIFVTDMNLNASSIDNPTRHLNFRVDSNDLSTSQCFSPSIPPPPYELPPYADKPPPYSTIAHHGEVLLDHRSRIPIRNVLRDSNRMALVSNRNRTLQNITGHRPTLSQLARQASINQHRSLDDTSHQQMGNLTIEAQQSARQNSISQTVNTLTTQSGNQQSRSISDGESSTQSDPQVQSHSAAENNANSDQLDSQQSGQQDNKHLGKQDYNHSDESNNEAPGQQSKEELNQHHDTHSGRHSHAQSIDNVCHLT